MDTFEPIRKFNFQFVLPNEAEYMSHLFGLSVESAWVDLRLKLGRIVMREFGDATAGVDLVKFYIRGETDTIVVNLLHMDGSEARSYRMCGCKFSHAHLSLGNRHETAERVTILPWVTTELQFTFDDVEISNGGNWNAPSGFTTLMLDYRAADGVVES